MPARLHKEAQAQRETAQRVRQMARTLPLDTDRVRIERQADALEREAALLEGRVVGRSDD